MLDRLLARFAIWRAMTADPRQDTQLPSEFRRAPVQFSIRRIAVMSSIMAFAGALSWVFIPKNDEVENVQNKSAESPNVDKSAKDTDLSANGNELAQMNVDQPQTLQSKNLGSKAVIDGMFSEGGYTEEVSKNAAPKLMRSEKLKVAFVARDLVNVRDKPGGSVIGQLTRGESVELMAWTDHDQIVKVKTEFGQVGYMSSELLSAEREFGPFSLSSKQYFSLDGISINIFRSNKGDEFDRHLNNFRALLKTIPVKPSLDFSQLKIKYWILSSADVLFPSDFSEVLYSIRHSSFSPKVFFEKDKSIGSRGGSSNLSIKTRLPVRLVGANLTSKSTVLNSVNASGTCAPFRATVKTVDSISSKLSFLVFDIRKNVAATLTTRPHRGDPSFTWAFADLNGDLVQDVAVYYGGENARWVYKYLFVAHNIDGRWQPIRMDDYSGVSPYCR